MVKIFELIKHGKQKLNNSDTPQLDAEVILSYLLDVDRVYLYINRDKVIESDIEHDFNKLIDRRANGEPIAYIIGKKEFMGMEFYVKSGVLIPRGDTEILVEEVIEHGKNIKNPIIADIGCGSGAISVSLAKKLENATVYALDLMDIPIETTRYNAELNEVNDKVIAIKSDIFSCFDKRHELSFDIIVSNPPYIEEDVIPTLMKDVREYEPKTALVGGKDGLDFYRRITKEAVNFLKPNGILAYEIGYNQRVEVINIMSQSGFSDIKCIGDLAGLDRVIIGFYTGIHNRICNKIKI